MSEASKSPIVDAQAHLWKASAPDYPWQPGATPQLPEPFTCERALAMMDDAGIDRLVVVPPGLNDVNSYALEAAARHPDRFAVMGRIPLEDPASAALIPAWKQQPGMLGIRITFLSPRHAALLVGDQLAWFWAAAEKAAVPVMFLAIGRSGELAPVAERHPGLPLIVDHMGVNASVAKAGRMAQAIAEVAALARYPNVSVKLSNLPNSSLEEYPYKDLDPHIERLYQAFGPQRCHWGTDVTNGLARADWKTRLAHFRQLSFIPAADKAQIMGPSILKRLQWA